MKVNRVGYHSVHSAEFSINRPSGSGDYLLLILKSGAVFALGDREVVTRPLSFMLFKKGTPQFYRADGTRFVNDFVHFDMTEEEAKELSALGIPFDMPTPCGGTAFFSQIIKLMSREAHGENPCEDGVSEAALRLIVAKLAAQRKENTSVRLSAHYDKMLALRERIFRCPDEDLTVAKMAESVALSRSFFQHTYKSIFGVSPVSDVIQSRVERAKYLLESTSYTVAHVAVECGYRTEIHFFRQFKAAEGVTPTEYRRHHGGSA